MDCDLELFTFLTTVSEVLKHMKHCFLVNAAFLLPFWVTLAFVCVQLDTGLEIFQLFRVKKFVTIWKVTRGEEGQGKR